MREYGSIMAVTCISVGGCGACYGRRALFRLKPRPLTIILERLQIPERWRSHGWQGLRVIQPLMRPLPQVGLTVPRRIRWLLPGGNGKRTLMRSARIPDSRW
jgi:hypothetical protein